MLVCAFTGAAPHFCPPMASDQNLGHHGRYSISPPWCAAHLACSAFSPHRSLCCSGRAHRLPTMVPRCCLVTRTSTALQTFRTSNLSPSQSARRGIGASATEPPITAHPGLIIRLMATLRRVTACEPVRYDLLSRPLTGCSVQTAAAKDANKVVPVFEQLGPLGLRLASRWSLRRSLAPPPQGHAQAGQTGNII